MRSRTLSLLVVAASTLLGACKEDAGTHADFHELAASQATAGASGAGTAGAAGDSSPGTAGNMSVSDGSAEDATESDGGTSSGCGQEPGIPRNTFVLQHLTTVIDATTKVMGDRSYYVKLPPDYDLSKPLRVIYLGTGCNGDGRTSYAFDKVDGGGAILIGLNPLQAQTVGGTNVAGKPCFDDQVANSIEIPFFDALHKQVENNFCVDKTRQFWAGYSSGSWMANIVGCAFADVVRAVAGTSGGLPALPACKGPIAQMFIHDMMDMGNNYSGSVSARQRTLSIDQCNGTATAPYDPGPGATIPNAMSQCLKYTGCPAAYPVIFCTTYGQGHSSQDPLAVGGFWNFFKSF
jgi:poly(3-hydroxybutyrate) depolymerase